MLETHSLDSFLLSKRRDNQDEKNRGQMKKLTNNNNQNSDDQKYKYMLFVWNGKNTGATVKSQTLTKGYALDEYLQQAKDSGLNVLFSGGVVKNKKLQRGNIYIFEDVIDQQKMLKKKQSKHAPTENPNEPTTEQIIKTYESVYLLKWLFPETAIKQYR